MRIYTRTGDDGSTGLAGGDRVLKCDLRVECYGTLDELNVHLGMLRTYPLRGSLEGDLLSVQSWIFALGAELAFAGAPSLGSDQVVFLEQRMDQMTLDLPPLAQFVLPGGSASACQAHIARTVCRRAERLLIRLDQTQAVRSEAKQFVNRLSDWLFVVSRWLVVTEGKVETPWRNPFT